MTVKEAEETVREMEESGLNDEGNFFLLTEALEFLIEEKKDPRDMMYLGGLYYEKRDFDLALKYYEMAATYDLTEAFSCLGYVWYYGRTGTRDYEKAFKYFSKAAKAGDIISEYKVADMYKNGYYVEKDYDKYTQMIETLYEKLGEPKYVDDPLPEIYTRLAKIREKQGRTDEAIKLYLSAKDFLAQRLRYNGFFGNLNIMNWLINDLYALTGFDEDYFDLYDLYYLLKTPHKVSFKYNGKKYSVESVTEDGTCAVHFGKEWYRAVEDFFARATVEGKRLTALYFDLYDMKMISG